MQTPVRFLPCDLTYSWSVSNFIRCRITQGLARLQAQHEFVRPGVFFFEIMTVVRSGERNAELFMDFNQPRIRNPLVIQPIGLHFQVKLIPAEDLLEFLGHRERSLHVSLAYQIGNFATKTTRQGDETLMVFF